MKLLAVTCCYVDVFVHSGTLLPGDNALNVREDWAIQKDKILRNSPDQEQTCDIAPLGANGENVYGQAIHNAFAQLAIDTSYLH